MCPWPKYADACVAALMESEGAGWVEGGEWRWMQLGTTQEEEERRSDARVWMQTAMAPKRAHLVTVPADQHAKGQAPHRTVAVAPRRADDHLPWSATITGIRNWPFRQRPRQLGKSARGC